MPNYTICPRLIEFCGSNMPYLANILYVFAQENPIKITKDDNSQSLVIQDYRKIAEKYFEIYQWLNFLDKTRGSDAFVKVKIPKKKYSGLELYITLCINTVGKKKLLTLYSQDYQSFGSKCDLIQILDKDETKNELSKPDTVIITATEGSAVSMGDYSPINK